MREGRAWTICFGICSALLLLPLWVAPYPPLVDLPQNAVQIAIGRAWRSGAFNYPHFFEFNLLANPAIPHALAYGLSTVLPVGAAMKCVLSAALLGVPLATWAIVRSTGGNPWWVFITFPVAYGYAFMWGFVSFVVAAPVALIAIEVTRRYNAQPSNRRAVGLAALMYALFLCHVLVLAYAGLACLAMVLLGATTSRDRVRGALALASVAPLTAAWWLATQALTPDTTPVSAPTIGAYGIDRIVRLLVDLLGRETPTPISRLAGLLVLFLPLLSGARLAPERWRLAPLVVALLFYLAMPLNALDTAFLYPRFALFVVPAYLFALEPLGPERKALRPVLVGFAAFWLGFVAIRFHAFGRESADLLALFRAAEPNKRLLSLVENPRSAEVEFSPYLHFGIWYQVERGGIADFSFAEFYPNRFRYRSGQDPPLPYNVEWEPRQFRWQEHGGELYDYFLIQRESDEGWSPFEGATTDIRLVAQAGTWSLYRQVGH